MNRILRGRSLRSTNWIEDTRGELALEALGLPTRAARALYAAGYRTRADIQESPDAELLLVPGMGPARLAATRAAVPYAPTMVTLWEDPDPAAYSGRLDAEELDAVVGLPSPASPKESA